MRSGGDLVDVAEAVDRDLCEANISSRFITFLLIALDAQSHRLVIVNAGHICPIIRRAGGRLEFIGEEEKGLPLGIDSNASYQTVSVDLEAGDVVVLYTDGLTDITNRDGSMFGQARVEALVAETEGGPVAVGEALFKAVRGHGSGIDQFDDIALLCFGRG